MHNSRVEWAIRYVDGRIQEVSPTGDTQQGARLMQAVADALSGVLLCRYRHDDRVDGV